MTNRLHNEPWWPWDENQPFRYGPWLLWDEKRRFQDALWWGAMLIWAGLIFIVDSMGALPEIGRADAWSWIILGAGTLSLGMNAWRHLAPEVRPPHAWDYIWTTLFLVWGLSSFANTAVSWPLIIIIIGLIIVVSAVMRRE